MRNDDWPAYKLVVLLIFSCVSLIPAVAIAGGLSAEEQRMADWIDAHAEDAISLLKDAVDIPSGTLNHEGVREVGKVMARELDVLGLETEWIDLPPEVNRAGHLFGRKDGDGKKFLVAGIWLNPAAAEAEKARLGLPPASPDEALRPAVEQRIAEVNAELARFAAHFL